MVIIAFESAQKQRTFRTRECETKVKKRATFDSSLFRHTSSSTTDRLRTCSSSQTPVKTNKKKERRVSVQVLDILVIIAFTKQKKKQHSKDFLSFSFSLSLLGKNTLSKKAHFVQCTHITAFSNRLRCIIIVSIITFHQKGERERDPRSLSRARTTRESSSSAPGRDTKQKNLSLLRIRI